MRTIIAGSRGLSRADLDLALARCPWTGGITTVISGGARGIDLAGEEWATEHGLPWFRYVPDWDGLGRSAGMVRNETMAQNADACVTVWDGRSRGTYNMRLMAAKYGLVRFTHHVGPRDIFRDKVHRAVGKS